MAEGEREVFVVMEMYYYDRTPHPRFHVFDTSEEANAFKALRDANPDRSENYAYTSIESATHHLGSGPKASEGWYQRKVEVLGETIYELVTAQDGQGFGVAVADITSSVPHYHERTQEWYQLISGKLVVSCGLGLSEKHILDTPGEIVGIPLGEPHSAGALGSQPARVLVITMPAWSLEDHHIVENA